MKEVIFVGWVDKGKVPVVGETTKNQYIIAELKKYCKVIILDFYKKNRHPWIYLQALFVFATHRKASIVLSTSASNIYLLLKIFKKIGVKRNIVHWVVGGAFGKLVEEGRFDKDVFNYVSFNLVQCHGMVSQLEKIGIRNAKFVLNFKKIDYYPDINECLKSKNNIKPMRFVYFGRIHPDKGCEYIFDAVKELNMKGYVNQFNVDFYGPFDLSYKESFLNKINQYDNVSYQGILNLKKDHKSYDLLATYHAMLFPTHWQSEGFAGVFIDAYIAALPVFASDWGYNGECLTNGKQGVIFPANNVDALIDTMENCIQGKYDLRQMAINARAEGAKYDAENALTKEYLKSIGLVD